MTPGLTIYRYLPGDEPRALAAARFLRRSAWTISEAEEFLADRRNFLIGAEADGRPVGYLLAYEMMRLDGDHPMMCLYDLEVAEPFRRLGIGRRLVAEASRHCREHDFLKMWVLTDEGNGPARALYEVCGAEADSGDPVLYVWRFGD